MPSALLLLFACAQQPEWALPPIEYGTRPSSDRVARLVEELERGERTLGAEGQAPTLREILEALGVAPESQTAVFSRTSMQAKRITPRRPRAVYFSDEVYVGFVPGGDLIEVSAIDAREGLVFYSLDRGAASPRFERETHRCLQCHAPPRSGNLPAHLVRSVHPEPSGEPRFRAGSVFVDPTTPYEQRWGGWYVTGDAGELRHLGNQVLAAGEEQLAPRRGARTTLGELCDASPYPAETSDVVALLVLEHQTHAHNALVWAGYEARRALDYQRMLNEALGEPEGTPVRSTESRLDAAARRVVEALLMVGEPPLPGRIGEGSAFAASFQARGRRDDHGRSLRDLDLEERLFRYPLSYTIDSVAFAGLPETLRRRIWTRLHRILTGTAADLEAVGLTPGQATAIVEILGATRRDALPEGW